MDQAALDALLSQTQYPQMTVNESMIARAWIQEHGADFDAIGFNTRLGNTVDLGEGFDEVTRRQAALLSQKRADIIAQKGTTVTIVEVKLRVSLAALGQLLGYELLWKVENPATTRVNLVAIGHDALVDVPEILRAHNVAVELFPNVLTQQLPYG